MLCCGVQSASQASILCSVYNHPLKKHSLVKSCLQTDLTGCCAVACSGPVRRPTHAQAALAWVALSEDGLCDVCGGVVTTPGKHRCKRNKERCLEESGAPHTRRQPRLGSYCPKMGSVMFVGGLSPRLERRLKSYKGRR